MKNNEVRKTGGCLIPAIILILIISFALSCECKRYDPPYPHGTPDNVINYVNGNYRTVNYVYWCYYGKYISYKYTSEYSCDEWEETIFEAAGICK